MCCDPKNPEKTITMKTNVLIGSFLLFSCLQASAQPSFPKSGEEDREGIMSEAYWKIWNRDVQEKIDRDIEKNRKADAVLSFADGRPGTEVRIEQVSHDFIFGAHIFNFDQLGTKERNDRYKSLYGTLFNSATIAFYWNAFEMQPGRLRFKGEYWDTEEYWNKVEEPKMQPHWRRPASDPVVEFCESRGIRLHGHTLVWGNRRWQYPNWIADELMTGEEKAKMAPLVKEYASKDNTLRADEFTEAYERLSPKKLAGMLPDFTKKIADVQRRRIVEIAEYYQGRIHSWDVVNESAKDYALGNLVEGEELCKSWYGLMPGEYDYKALKTAEEVFPESVALNINDYYRDGKGKAYADQVKGLLARGCRIDIMGSQMHQLGAKGSRSASEGAEIETPQIVWDRLGSFGETGVPIHMSEVTIASPGNGKRDWAIQAVLTRNMFRLWFSVEPVMGITWWNVVDDCGAAGESSTSGLFTRNMEPKTAYYALDELVNEEWKTRKTILLPESGTVRFRGFKGKYRVTWTDRFGQTQISEFYLKNDGDGFGN